MPRHPHISASLTPASNHSLPGWEDLSHSGLLLDAARIAGLAGYTPAPLGNYAKDKLRRRAIALLDGAQTDSAEVSRFVAFVLEEACGFDAATGVWQRGSHVPPAEGRRIVTGETVKPRHLWKGPRGARLPVFLDDAARLGIGRSRRAVGQALAYLRAGREHLALLTNGRHWRLLFAGMDFDASCQWDAESWFAQGELAPQVTALRTLLQPKLWTPAQDAAPPLLQGIRDTRKGQAELSEVLGERVRKAVEILIQGHGEALQERCANVDRRTSTAPPAGWRCGWWWRCSPNPASCCRAATPCTTRATASKGCGRGWPPRRRGAWRWPRAMPHGPACWRCSAWYTEVRTSRTCRWRHTAANCSRPAAAQAPAQTAFRKRSPCSRRRASRANAATIGTFTKCCACSPAPPCAFAKAAAASAQTCQWISPISPPSTSASSTRACRTTS